MKINVDEEYIINELKCLIILTRKNNSIYNKKAVEKALWGAIYEIAAAKHGIAADREKFEELYRRNSPSCKQGRMAQ